jgi:WD40 repeat protein
MEHSKFEISIIFLTLLLLINTVKLSSQTLAFKWNLTNQSGEIYDMQFMPDNNYFILCTDTDFQIRNTETGELVQTYPFGGSTFEFTPDSSKIILIPPEAGGEDKKLQLRNINDMSLIREYIIPPDSNDFNLSFRELKVDPVRPFVYVIYRKTKRMGIYYYHTSKVQIYNYETMEFLGNLTTEDD